MAVTCVHCGTVNPDGNTICMSCGMPLKPVPAEAAATASDTPPPDLPGVALPVLDEPLAVPSSAMGSAEPDQTSFLPPGYAAPGTSPYLPAPAQGAAPVHRTGHLSVIAIVGIISVVFGGAGAVEAALRTGPSTSPPPASAPANVPASAGSGGSGSTQTATNGSLTTTPFAKVFVPPGFSINDQGSDYIVLTQDSSDTNALGVQSEPLTSTRTNAELDQDLLAGDQQNGDPSAKFCNTKAPAHTQLMGSGGPINADVITICETVTPTGGPALAAVDGFVDAVATTSSGSLEAIWVEIFAAQNDYQSFSDSLPAALFTETVFTNASPLT